MSYFSNFRIYILLILGFNQVFAHAVPYESCCNKSPVPIIDQVISDEKSVFLRVDDFWLCAEAFQTSGQDSFVMIQGEWMPLAQAIEGGAKLTSWKCKRCERYNLEGVNACAYCGKSRYE